MVALDIIMKSYFELMSQELRNKNA